MRVGSISAALSFPEQRLVIEPTWGERLLNYLISSIIIIPFAY